MLRYQFRELPEIQVYGSLYWGCKAMTLVSVREGYYPSCSLNKLRIEMNEFNSVPAVTGVSRYVTLL